MRKHLIIVILILAIFFLIDISMFAQCPMCKMAAESNMKEGGSVGKGLNTGILYLLAMPYLAVFTFAWLYKRHQKKLEQ